MLLGGGGGGNASSDHDHVLSLDILSLDCMLLSQILYRAMVECNNTHLCVR